MQLQFLGATQTVTGSKYLLTTEHSKYLVDCGLFQGLKELRLRNWSPLPVDPGAINAVILTHAHLDHSGYLPLLIKNGFKGKVYCTAATKDLCAIILPDSGHLQEEEANRANRYGYSKHKPALPLYTHAEAEKALNSIVGYPFDQDINLDHDLVLNFRRAGHILGAASTLFKFNTTSILFSGDLGRQNDPCIFPPEPPPAVDYLVIESTYGDRLHENVDPKDKLAEVINRTVKRGGTVILPTFTVGRTQNILYYLYLLRKNQIIPDVPVFLDSPMAEEATKVLLKHYEEHRLPESECVAACNMVRYVASVEDSKKIDTYAFPKIIISASGMATGGRVLHHIKVFGGDARNAILFTGYQAAGTRGASMLQGKKEIKMLGEIVKINAEVVALDNVSAHADYQETLNWLKGITKPPRKVFISHGEPQAAQALKAKIEQAFGWRCEVPEYLETAVLI